MMGSDYVKAEAGAWVDALAAGSTKSWKKGYRAGLLDGVLYGLLGGMAITLVSQLLSGVLA